MADIKWKMHGKPRAFYWELPHDSDSAVVVVPQEDGSLEISVSEEKAVDSYNALFDCSITLPKKQALKLRDLLNITLAE